jgi:DNA-binding MarR family transcriptional regulator
MSTKRAVPEPLIQVGDDFEDEYPGASALATECYANVYKTANLLIDLHNRHTRDAYGLSQAAREVLAVVEGAGEPLEPTIIAQRLLVTTGAMTSLLDTLEKRELIERLPHPEDRRKLLVDVTPEARAIVDELLPSLHLRERDVMSAALSPSEQKQLLNLTAKVQKAAIEAGSLPQPSGDRRLRPQSPAETGRQT